MNAYTIKAHHYMMIVSTFVCNAVYWLFHLHKLPDAIRQRNGIVVKHTDDIEVWMELFEWTREHGDWRPWIITILARNMRDDCVANYERIYTKDGVKAVGDLQIGDMALSYDFTAKQYCYKPITRIIEKGRLNLKRVYAGRGINIRHVDVTNNSPFMFKHGKLGYKKGYLNDKDIGNHKKHLVNTIPIAKHIPYLVEDQEWLNKKICFVIGHFVAEGWTTENGLRVYTCGYESHYVSKILDEFNIPYSMHKNNNGVPYITFFKSWFSEYLSKILSNSFDISLPSELFKLPPEKIEAFLDGYYAGDGGMHRDVKCYTTSSDRLAKDLVRIHLQLGLPIGGYLCLNHQGVGNKPIWRMHSSKKERVFKDYGYQGLSEATLLNTESIGEYDTRDFEVQDTHVFFFENGIMGHNCDGASAFARFLFKRMGHEAYTLTLWNRDSKSGHDVCYCPSLSLLVSNNDVMFIPPFGDWEKGIIKEFGNLYTIIERDGKIIYES